MFTLTLIVAGLANGALYGLLALGLVLIYKTQDMVNFAHGEFFMAGAFIGFATYQLFGFPYPVAFILAITGGLLVGWLTERVVIHPIANHPHVTLTMVTIGVSYTIKGAVRLQFGGDIRTIPPLFKETSVSFFGVPVSTQSLLNIGLALLLTMFMLLLFQFTSLGKQMRATQQNQRGAQVIGINTARIYSLTWGLTAAIGAAAGFLAAPVTLVYPDMGTQVMLKAIAAAVLGGFGSVGGAIVGGFIVGIAEMLTGGFISTSLIDVASYFVIIFVMMVRPQGLFGRAAVSRV